MQGEWWYATGDTRNGPVSLQSLRQLLLESKVSEGTLVWKEGRESWTPLSEVPDLIQVVRAVPPELPKPTAREHLIALPHAGPWRRFLARMIDYWMIGLPTTFLTVFAVSWFSPAFSLWLQNPSSSLVIGWFLLPLVLFVEVAIVALFGTTLGKALLGITVTTVGAQRLTVSQYIHRQFGVYWYGLGTGFPLVSLFTMHRQRSRLKAGVQASYDEGKFNVKASKLGAMRVLLAAILVLGITFFNAYLQQVSQSSDRDYYTGTTWVNEVTGKPVAIPNGWIHEEQKNDQKRSVHVFSGPNQGVYVVFTKEDVLPSMNLETYLNSWVVSVRSNMRLSMPGQQTFVGTLQAVTLTGTMADDKTQRLRVTFVKKGRQVWRVVILSISGKEPTSEYPMKLQELLFQSIE